MSLICKSAVPITCTFMEKYIFLLRYTSGSRPPEKREEYNISYHDFILGGLFFFNFQVFKKQRKTVNCFFFIIKDKIVNPVA